MMEDQDFENLKERKEMLLTAGRRALYLPCTKCGDVWGADGKLPEEHKPDCPYHHVYHKSDYRGRM